jgi:hypothetical protein
MNRSNRDVRFTPKTDIQSSRESTTTSLFFTRFQLLDELYDKPVLSISPLLFHNIKYLSGLSDAAFVKPKVSFRFGGLG